MNFKGQAFASYPRARIEAAFSSYYAALVVAKKSSPDSLSESKENSFLFSFLGGYLTAALLKTSGIIRSKIFSNYDSIAFAIR